MKTMAIANQKGGCGKTTTAINLAGALASMSKKILVIDLDPQAHASFGLGASNPALDKTVYNVLTDNPEKRRLIEDCITRVSENLDIVPSSILLSTLEQELKDKDDAVSKLHRALYTNPLGYDYVIVDCPPNLGFLTFNALRAADIVIVPIDMSAFSLMGVGKLLGMLELIKIKINHAPRVNALATLFDKRTTYCQTMLEEIRSFFKDQLLSSVIRSNVALRKAAASGMPVVQFDRRSNGANDYFELAREFLRADGCYEFEKALKDVDKAIEQSAQTIEATDAARVQVDTPRIPAIESRLEAAPVSVPINNPFRNITFGIEAPQANSIYVVGDFNGWKVSDDHRLSRLPDGKWERTFELLPGKYRYKFVIDGQWVHDQQNPANEQNSFGTFDSVLQL